MSFQWVRLLWLLWLIPVLVAAYILAIRRRQKYALRFASLKIVREALVPGPGIRRHIPAALFLLAVAVLIFALARPASFVTLPSQRSTVILAIDISGSMRAEDIAPSRMEAAKTAARVFVEQQPRDVRIGIVAFSATSAVVQAPTTDRDELLSAVNRLRTQRGTAIGSGIITSLNAIFEGPGGEPISAFTGSYSRAGSTPMPQQEAPGAYAQAVVVLLSDGQSNQGPDPIEVVEQAVSLGVRIFTVGLGSLEGAVIGVMGRSIRVFLDEETLKSIARRTDASYFKADSETKLREIYEYLSSRFVLERKKTEITAIFAAAGVALLLVCGTLSLLWFNRLP